MLASAVIFDGKLDLSGIQDSFNRYHHKIIEVSFTSIITAGSNTKKTHVSELAPEGFAVSKIICFVNPIRKIMYFGYNNTG